MNFDEKISDIKNLYPKCLDLKLDEESQTAETIDKFVLSSVPAYFSFEKEKLDRIQGSLIGLALGDSLGAPVEFRPYEYLQVSPVKDLRGGGTWGLEKGKFTDDTSMALCLASSLITHGDFVPYDQLLRYTWWQDYGYMSSTGECFDIGTATSEALKLFSSRKKKYFKKFQNIEKTYPDGFDVYCGDNDGAGNGALMRLAPVPLFFHRNLFESIEFSGRSGLITHGSEIAYDSCRYYSCLIVKAVQGYTKEQLTEKYFYKKHRNWFGEKGLHQTVENVANGSFRKRNGYKDGIRGGGFIVQALEAALWAFWKTNDFKSGALLAVNLGDDTDTVAAIYGQLAGAFYGFNNLPEDWVKDLYGKDFILMISKWIYFKGDIWDKELSTKTKLEE